MTNVAINGLGRTGRMLLRRYLAEEPKGVQVVALNDLMPIETLAYLLKFDSVHGKLPDAIDVQDGQLKIGDRLIKVLCEKDPDQMPWKALGDPHSSIVDGLSTRVLQGHSAKVLVWYDNEVGYTQRLLDAVSVLSL